MISLIKKLFANSEPTLIERLTSNSRKRPVTPLSLFTKMTRDELKWIFLNYATLDDVIKEVVPSLPPKQMQLNWTGMSGDTTLTQALNFVDITYDCYRKIGKEIDVHTKILDFGCGWGRIIRFFMADVHHENLFGIDCYEEALEAAKQHNKWCQFSVSKTMPPTDCPDNSFDIIYLYSVFSHLSEEAHMLWVNEFNRLLKPGGLLIATTRPRQMILACKHLRDSKNLKEFESGAASSFLDNEAELQRYDDGLFCFSGTGGGGPLDSSFYGEACISKKYVERNWTSKFKLLDYRAADNKVDQNVICCVNK